jgi:hypothetical protein
MIRKGPATAVRWPSISGPQKWAERAKKPNDCGASFNTQGSGKSLDYACLALRCALIL